MKKGLLQRDSKRWIDKIPESEFKSLKESDRRNYLRFQNLSKSRRLKEMKLQGLRDEMKMIKSHIDDLRGEEESQFLKIQFLHNVWGVRVDVVRQSRVPESIKPNVSYRKNKYIRRTHRGKPLKVHYVWNGKIYSSSLEKVKPIYFQTEEKLKSSIQELTGKPLNDMSQSYIKSFLKESYTRYVRFLLKKKGVVSFSRSSVLFKYFMVWYKTVNHQ